MTSILLDCEDIPKVYCSIQLLIEYCFVDYQDLQ